MGKLKAVLLTEGMHGMISQVEGLAKALNTEYIHKIVRLSFPWNLIPSKFTPFSNIIFKAYLWILYVNSKYFWIFFLKKNRWNHTLSPTGNN